MSAERIPKLMSTAATGPARRTTTGCVQRSSTASPRSSRRLPVWRHVTPASLRLRAACLRLAASVAEALHAYDTAESWYLAADEAAESADRMEHP